MAGAVAAVWRRSRRNHAGRSCRPKHLPSAVKRFVTGMSTREAGFSSKRTSKIEL